MSSKHWLVVGGGDKGGIVVREGRALTSDQAKEAPKDYTKPQQTVRSPTKTIQSPDRLYKAPTDNTKTRQILQRPKKTIQRHTVLDKTRNY